MDITAGFLFGAFLGILFAFLITKRTINKKGAGELKVCQSCPLRSFKHADKGVKPEDVATDDEEE